MREDGCIVDTFTVSVTVVLSSMADQLKVVPLKFIGLINGGESWLGFGSVCSGDIQ